MKRSAALAFVAAMTGAFGPISGRPAKAGSKSKPVTKCLAPGCNNMHTTGKPCCSSACGQAWRASRRHPDLPQKVRT